MNDVLEFQREQFKRVFIQLNDIKSRQDEHSQEFHTLGDRMNALELHMAALQSQLPSVWEEVAGIKRRIERIERRLDLVD